MYYSEARNSTSISNHRKHNATVQKVQEASETDGDKLSPVNLDIKEASAVQLPPLVWTNYQVTPELMTVRNSGFTVMINARFRDEIPSVSGGPLNGNYSFSQVHFHWGEHDETGSSHAVDGVRYPLEMHVVHLKKDCANLGEAFQRKDGIAVMVYLFALREERNAGLDQLTAILQFIQRPRCCARLYPTPLAEIVYPFTQDYLLYWGAVGSPSGQHRILWFISRNVLPVSTHQLEEFRQLRDPQGKLLVSNSSKPQPLAGRLLFLVSPSEKMLETMYGVSRRATQSTFDSVESVELRDAEFKSMANLEDNDTDYEDDNCRICPIRRKPVQNSRVPGIYRVNEGDTSVEESCIDLADNAGVTVQAEMKCHGRQTGPRVVTNVNVTTCQHKEKTANHPSEAVYSVISARGSELHLKRRPMIVRQDDSSQEQACVFLNRPPTYPTFSAPSFSDVGEPLVQTQEHTNLTDLPVTNDSSEIAVHNRDSEVWPGTRRKPQPLVYDRNIDHYEEEITNTNLVNSHKTKKVIIKGYDYIDENNTQPADIYGQEKNPQIQNTSRNANFPTQEVENIEEYFFEDNGETDKECSQFLLVKEVKNDRPLYKVVGKLQKGENRSFQRNPPADNSLRNDRQKPTLNPPAKTNGISDENDKRFVNTANNFMYEESQFSKETEYKDKSQRKVVSKGNYYNPYPPLKQKQTEKAGNETKEVPKFEKQDHVVLKKTDKEKQEDDPCCKVSLLVRATCEDHRKSSRKEKLGKEYYVTKISPIENKNYVSPNGSETDVKKCFRKSPTVETRPIFNAEPIIARDDSNEKQDGNNSKLMKPQDSNNQNSLNKSSIIHPNDQSTRTEELYEEYNEESKERKQKHYKQTMQLQGDIKNGTNQESESSKTAVQPILSNNKGNLVKSEEKNLDDHLTEKVNVYHKETEEGGHVHMAQKTIAGKMGNSQSTDVFANNQVIQAIEPQKTDITKDLDYDLRKLKHPETQKFSVKDPSKGPTSKAVITQQLSLDQKIKGHTQVKQTVEYSDKRNPKIQENENAINSLKQTYEEKSYEQSSTVKKPKLHQENLKHIQQNADLVPFDNPLKINTNDIRREKDDLLNKCYVDLKQLLPENHLENKALGETKKEEYKSSGGNEELKYPKANNYEFMEQSSESENLKSSRQHKTVVMNNVNTGSFPSRQIISDNKPVIPKQSYVTENEPLSKKNPSCNSRVDPQKPDNSSKQIIQENRKPVGENTEYNNEYEETLEENTSLSTSHRKKQKVVQTVVKGEALYKVPGSNIVRQPNNEAEINNLIRIPKVEIPEPHYITRLPKQPLEEFEACPVNPHQPFQVMTETFEETSSVVTTNKTFMMFKKTTAQAALTQPLVKQLKDYQDNKKQPAQDKPDKPLNEAAEVDPNNTQRTSQAPLNDSNKKLQVKKESVQPVTNPKPSERKFQQDSEQFLSEYHYSETSMSSENKRMHKERKYRYTGQQPGLSEIQENIPPFLENQRLQLDDQENLTQSTNKIRNNELRDDTREVEDVIDQNKPKMVVGSYQLQKPVHIATSKVSEPNDVKKINEQEENLTRPEQNDPHLRSGQHYFSEEYNESSAKEHRSTQKRVISIRGGPTILNQKGFPDTLNGNKYPGLKEPPTKDLKLFEDEQEPVSESSSEERNNGQKQSGLTRNQDAVQRGNNFDVDKTSQSMKNGANSSLPLSKTDGDIVIYIRQPRKKEHVLAPKITVDVTDSHSMTRSEQDAQKVQIHEIKPKKANERKVIKPRKSKSADIYHTSFNNGSSEEGRSRGMMESSESNEEQVLDTTHYNLTLKSETQVELPEGQSARVKSKADVTITPGKSTAKTRTNQMSTGLIQNKTNTSNNYSSQAEKKTRTNQDSNYADINCDQTSSFEDVPEGESSSFNQSPIRIDTSSSVVKKYPKLQFHHHWNIEGDAILENNGKTLRASLVKENREGLSEPLLSGGPLTAQYVFYELHFHWGHKDCCGAEHIIDNQRHTLEGHFLYFKREYKNLKTALNFQDGLAVVSVNLTVGGPPNVLLGELVKDIHLLREPDTGTYVPARSLFSWMKLALQANKGYYSYNGSLTSQSPRVECVTWLVFPQPIVFCCQQSSEFRKLRSAKGELLTKNFRSPQPLNNRIVYYVPL